MTVVISCRCNHKFQDERYGRGKRVHNPSGKGPRCTVCGDVKTGFVIKEVNIKGE